MGLLHWVRSDLGVTVGTGISTWADQSGNANDLTQATGSKQPAFSAAGAPRSRPCAVYDGVDDFMTATFTLNHPMTRLTVGDFNAIFAAVDTLLDGNGGANRGRLARTTGTTMQVNPGSLAGSVATTTSWHVYTLLMNGVSSSWRSDNVQVAAGDASSNTAIGGSTQGALGTGSGSWANVSIAEDVMFSSILTESQLTRLSHYAGSRYALAS